MATQKRTDDVLWGLKLPVIEHLVRGATPRRQRWFAIACARLAARVMGLDGEQALRSVMLRLFEAAEWLAEGGDPSDARVNAARADAAALAQRYDEIQLDLIGQIEAEAERDGIHTVDHPRYPAYHQASIRHAAVEAAEVMLNEDPLAAAALNFEILYRSIRIDYETGLALSRHWLVDAPSPIDRDDVWPIFKRFPDEQEDEGVGS